ncbi:MAG: sigma-70 family RNA polymerase sigma factor [Pseudomonadota bacterium]
MTSDTSDSRESGRSGATIEELYINQFETLVAFVRSKYGDGPPLPEDVAQHAFTQLIERDTVDDIGSLPGFLWRTAINFAIAQNRKQAVLNKRASDVAEHFFPEGSNKDNPERVYLGKADIEFVMRVISKMPSTRRRAFLLNRVDGMSHRHIAVELGLSRPTVTKHIAKAAAEIEAALMGE